MKKTGIAILAVLFALLPAFTQADPSYSEADISYNCSAGSDCLAPGEAYCGKGEVNSTSCNGTICGITCKEPKLYGLNENLQAAISLSPANKTAGSPVEIAVNLLSGKRPVECELQVYWFAVPQNDTGRFSSIVIYSIIDEKYLNLTAEGVTGKNGRFTFIPVEAGRYFVKALGKVISFEVAPNGLPLPPVLKNLTAAIKPKGAPPVVLQNQSSSQFCQFGNCASAAQGGGDQGGLILILIVIVIGMIFSVLLYAAVFKRKMASGLKMRHRDPYAKRSGEIVENARMHAVIDAPEAEKIKVAIDNMKKNAGRQDPRKTKVSCPECGFYNEKDAKFCEGCFAKLENGDKNTWFLSR